MSKKSRTDLLVRQRFQNPLPAPAFPPKLLTIKTDPARYATYDFLVPLAMERPVPMLVDAEGGMPLDQSMVPGYWESADHGRSGRMVPDMSVDPPVLDDEDLALLVDPPGINQAGAGIMPSTSGANLDLVGSGGRMSGPAAQQLDKRKRDVAWLKRTDQTTAAYASQAAKKEALQNQLAAQPVTQAAELTLEEQVALIESTFSALDTPLDTLRHPTKAHLTATETFDILPDDRIWGNQYALFRFADNPFDDKRVGGSETPLPTTAQSGNLALFRPLETELDESGANRVAYFLPDDDEAALRYSTQRRTGRDVDWDIVHEADEAVDYAYEGEEDAPEEYQHGFRFIRDYDAHRREVRSEYIVSLEENVQSSEASAEQQGTRGKAAYYVPLTGHTLLRKRRARKGEPRNDYSDLGLEYWGGITVSLSGKKVLPEDEVLGRKEDIELVLRPSDLPASAGVGVNGDADMKSEEQPDVQNGSPLKAES